MRSYQLTGHENPILTLTEAPASSVGPDEVLIQMHAASLNYRDILQAQSSRNIVPLSDGAGVIKQLGKNVQGYKAGDRVVIGFMPGWIEGEFSAAKQSTSLGGDGVNGVLTEQFVVPAAAIARIPDSMTFEEASTLPCAGVTAWSALFERSALQPGETVLLLGTGGVSIFALQLAKLAGAKVIITSSSEDKLARAKDLGADHLINYKTHPDWEEEVLRITKGAGVDLAVDVGGPGTLNRTLKATRHGGRISLLGVLTGFEGSIDIAAIIVKRITLQGIYVGSVVTLKALCALNLKPQVDIVYDFEDAEYAYKKLIKAEHFGKVVIKIN